MPTDTKTSLDGTRSKIGDLSRRTEEVLLLLVADFENLREKLEAEIGKWYGRLCCLTKVYEDLRGGGCVCVSSIIIIAQY